MNQYQILFVCLGNICRSPLAEGVMRAQVKERGLQQRIVIDSCGTGAYHVGEPPHHGSRAIAKQHGVSLDGQRARQLVKGDLQTFDLVVAMDRENLHNIEQLGAASAEVILLRSYDEAADSLDVPDPYYSGGFDEVYDIISRSCAALLDEIAKRL